ncbi:MAG TPA: winged helix-turn-helix domain-containing protein [Vicinamibacterales bacterium]|nr:winged helix-turn-helix domain-containing protein [Vicinamibacterales bacterium]
MERVRFGMFDFLPSTGELRRGSVPVRLQAQPARVLAALVARPGEIVTRETLQREIWPDTHVDFERGLNFCIAQVRSALGDSADSPRFIETVPKHGYRFIAPVLEADGSQTGAEPQTEPHVTRGPATLGLTGRIVSVATAALVLIAAGLLWARGSSQPPAIVIVPFYNETGRPEHDTLARAVGDAVVARLAAPGRAASIGVIGNAPALRNPFARQDVQRIALDLDAPWVLIGQLKSDGTSLRVIAHLIRADDMKHLWAHTFDDPAFHLDAQTRTAEAIAVAVAASLASN